MSKFKKLIKKKEVEKALSKHPLKELPQEVKSDYIKGLVFIAVEDENFSEEEKSYIKTLMSHIGVEESLLGEFETFATEPDEDELMAFMDRIKEFDTDVKVNFLIEVILIAFRDGEFDEGEQEMFNDYVDMFELEDTKDDIMYMALALINKDIDLALSLYTAKKEFFLKYNYMFEMIGIDIEKELKNMFSYEWVRWDASYGGTRPDRKVALHNETVQKICIYLNSRIIANELKLISNTQKFMYENEVLFELTSSMNIKYENNLFQYENDKNEPILNSKDIITNYILWLQNHFDSKIQKMEVYSSRVSYSSSDRSLRFTSNCPGKPMIENLYEICWMTIGVNSEFTLSNQKINFYQHGNFGGSANDYTRSGKPEEADYTFRLMRNETEEGE